MSDAMGGDPENFIEGSKFIEGEIEKGFLSPEYGSAILNRMKEGAIFDETGAPKKEVLDTMLGLGSEELFEGQGIEVKDNQLGSVHSGFLPTLDYIDRALEASGMKGVRVTGGRDKFHQNRRNSLHNMGQAVDITPDIPNRNDLNPGQLDILNSILKDASANFPGLEYLDEYSNPSLGSTLGHSHLEFGDIRDLSRVAQRGNFVGPMRPREASGEMFYKVKKGDTLSRIAPRMGKTVEDIVRLNPGLDPDHIEIDQRLRIE
jgi:hypothetical protein